jgi:hypothetical protein
MAVAPNPTPTPTPAPAPSGSEPAPTPAPDPAPAPAPSPDPAPAAASWRDTITDADGKKFAESSADLNHFVGRALDMRKQLAKAIVPPGKDAKPEEVAAYRKAIGVPDAPEGYTFTTPAGREVTDADKAFQGTMAKLFHGANVSAEQAKMLNEGWNQLVDATLAAEIEADKAFAASSETTLRGKWQGPEYDRNRAIASRAAEKALGDNFEAAKQIQTKDGRFVLDHPILVEAFANIGREMGEDRMGPVLTETEAQTLQTKIDALQKQKVAAMDRQDSREAQRIENEQAQLYARMPGNGPIVGAQGRAA